MPHIQGNKTARFGQLAGMGNQNREVAKQAIEFLGQMGGRGVVSHVNGAAITQMGSLLVDQVQHALEGVDSQVCFHGRYL